MDIVDDSKLKMIEIELFKVFIKCCKTLSLKYYVIGGTLLGTIRHKGFIPWDDDIDVGLMRSDYEIFLKKAPSILPPYYFLQSITSEKEYLHIYAKLRDSRTTFIETDVKDRHMNHGVYLDIFPLDYYPERKMKQICMDVHQKLLSLRIWSTVEDSNYRKKSLITVFKIRLPLFYLNVRYKTTRDAVLARDKLCCSVKKSRFIANYDGAWGKKEIVPAEWYGNGVEGDFENIKVNLPVHYDKLLRQVYGDYMMLPPIEKRVTHHFTEIIDLDRPYTEYHIDTK